MNRITRRALCVATSGVILSWSFSAAGQTSDDSSPVVQEPPSEAPAISPEEQQAIEAALQADAEAEVPSTPAPAPTASSIGVGVGYDLALILQVAGAWFSEPARQLGAHDPDHTGFTLQGLEMTLGASVDPYFRLDANILFSDHGVEIEEAYATTLALPGNLQARAGQFLTRFGRLNATHPHIWRFLDQPLVNGKLLGGEGSRGVGAELSWLAPLPWFVELVGSATEAHSECCARSFYGEEELEVDNFADLLYTARLAQFFPLGDDLSLLWGLSAQFGPNPSGPGARTEIYGSDLYLRFAPVGTVTRTAVSLQVEAMLRRRQVPGDVLEDGGGRAELAWDITPRWQIAARYERVTGVEGDPLDPDWTSARQRIAAQGTFSPSHFSRIRLQLAHDDAEWFDAPIYAAMLGLEALIGAHGSHKF